MRANDALELAGGLRAVHVERKGELVSSAAGVAQGGEGVIVAITKLELVVLEAQQEDEGFGVARHIFLLVHEMPEPYASDDGFLVDI